MNESGHISVDGDFIRYRSDSYGDWELPVNKLRILGEATNQNGPFSDDYFLCFTAGPEEWFEASFYAEGREEFLRALGTRLGTSLEAGLCNSTDFASRVLWPPLHAGQPMFQYEPSAPRGFLGRIFGSIENTQKYTKEIAATLASDG